MKLFDNGSKSEEKQKELEAEQLRIQQEAEKQENLEKKLDELILVGKAIYTILKQEHEDRKAAHESLESMIQAATTEIIHTQEKAVKVMIAYGREENQKMTDAINEEVVKVQRVTAVAQKHLLAAAEELNNSIVSNTSVLSDKLSGLEESMKDINISVAAVPVQENVPAYVPEVTVETEPDFMFMPEMEEEVPVEQDIAFVLEQEESVEEETTLEDIFAVEEEEELIIPEPIIEAEPEVIPEPEEEPIPEPVVAAPVIDDPNRAMTPDEIAALIASVGGGDNAVEEPIPEPEPTPEPVVTAPVIDDPNRAMTPDEIAALIASVGGGNNAVEEEPIPEPEPIPVVEPEPVVAAPVIDDPNRAMTPDEIAALIASVSGGDKVVEEAPIPEPEPEPVAPAPVMDDPNRAMTPDEIAALIASMN